MIGDDKIESSLFKKIIRIGGALYMLFSLPSTVKEGSESFRYWSNLVTLLVIAFLTSIHDYRDYYKRQTARQNPFYSFPIEASLPTSPRVPDYPLTPTYPTPSGTFSPYPGSPSTSTTT